MLELARGGRLCGLTFEVTRGRRWDDWPARRIVYLGVARARRPAAGPRVDRGVRPHPWPKRATRRSAVHLGAESMQCCFACLLFWRGRSELAPGLGGATIGDEGA